MFNNFKIKLKEKKGISTIDFIISFLVFIMIFSFMFDMFFVGYKKYQVSKIASNVVRDVALQSGIKNKAPANFPGGSANYLDTTEATKVIKTHMDNMGITDYSVDFSMKDRNVAGSPIKSFRLASNHAGANTDYRGEITITINYKYKWSLWSNFVPLVGEGDGSVSRIAYGEYKHDYSSWKGEK